MVHGRHGGMKDMDWNSAGLHLGLLRVCRQIFGEVALLPYSLNSFVFQNTWVMKKVLDSLRPIQKRAIQRMYVLPESHSRYEGAAVEYTWDGKRVIQRAEARRRESSTGKGKPGGPKHKRPRIK